MSAGEPDGSRPTPLPVVRAADLPHAQRHEPWLIESLWAARSATACAPEPIIELEPNGSGLCVASDLHVDFEYRFFSSGGKRDRADPSQIHASGLG